MKILVIATGVFLNTVQASNIWKTRTKTPEEVIDDIQHLIDLDSMPTGSGKSVAVKAWAEEMKNEGHDVVVIDSLSQKLDDVQTWRDEAKEINVSDWKNLKNRALRDLAEKLLVMDEVELPAPNYGPKPFEQQGPKKSKGEKKQQRREWNSRIFKR